MSEENKEKEVVKKKSTGSKTKNISIEKGLSTVEATFSMRDGVEGKPSVWFHQVDQGLECTLVLNSPITKNLRVYIPNDGGTTPDKDGVASITLLTEETFNNWWSKVKKWLDDNLETTVVNWIDRNWNAKFQKYVDQTCKKLEDKLINDPNNKYPGSGYVNDSSKPQGAIVNLRDKLEQEINTRRSEDTSIRNQLSSSISSVRNDIFAQLPIGTILNVYRYDSYVQNRLREYYLKCDGSTIPSGSQYDNLRRVLKIVNTYRGEFNGSWYSCCNDYYRYSGFSGHGRDANQKCARMIMNLDDLVRFMRFNLVKDMFDDYLSIVGYFKYKATNTSKNIRAFFYGSYSEVPPCPEFPTDSFVRQNDKVRRVAIGFKDGAPAYDSSKTTDDIGDLLLKSEYCCLVVTFKASGDIDRGRSFGLFGTDNRPQYGTGDEAGIRKQYPSYMEEWNNTGVIIKQQWNLYPGEVVVVFGVDDDSIFTDGSLTITGEKAINNLPDLTREGVFWGGGRAGSGLKSWTIPEWINSDITYGFYKYSLNGRGGGGADDWGSRASGGKKLKDMDNYGGHVNLASNLYPNHYPVDSWIKFK